MYKTEKRGATKGKSGKYWTWEAGEVNAPKGELDHVPDMRWEGGITKKEIKKTLNEKGIEYDGRSSKDDLLELLQ